MFSFSTIVTAHGTNVFLGQTPKRLETMIAACRPRSPLAVRA
jgi:hypothetical protein